MNTLRKNDNPTIEDYENVCGMYTSELESIIDVREFTFRIPRTQARREVISNLIKTYTPQELESYFLNMIYED